MEAYAHVVPEAHDESTVFCAERARIYANRVQFSRAYTVLYGVVMLLSAALLVWVLVEEDFPLAHAVKWWIFVVMDTAVTLFVLLEILVSSLAQGWRRYITRCSNVVDLAVGGLYAICRLEPRPSNRAPPRPPSGPRG